MQKLILKLKQPWPDQVKGSWWKAPLIIIGYFYLRILSELWVLQRGVTSLDGALGSAFFTDQNSLYQLMAAAEWSYFLSSLGLALLVILVAYLLGFRFFDFHSFSRQNLLKTLGYFIVIYVIQITINLLILIYAPSYTQPANQEAVIGLVNTMNTGLIFLNIVIITPIIEEYLFRGLIMKYTFSLTPFLGALVSSVIFALLHSPDNIIDFAIYYVLSAGITFLYWYTRRLEYPILFHIIQNFIGFIGIQLLS